MIKMAGLPLGKQTITFIKEAYRPQTREVTIFVKQKQLGTIAMRSAGIIVDFSVIDWVDGKPVAGAVVELVNAVTLTDKDGSAKPSVLPRKIRNAKVVI